MATNYPSIPSKRLKANVSSSATAFSLQDIKGWKDNTDTQTDLASTDFGTVGFGVFRSLTDTSKIEFFTFDPATITSSSITFVKRGLGVLGTFDTEGSARKCSWTTDDTIVELGSHPPRLLYTFVNTENIATISAIHTYTVLPQSAVAPISGSDFVNKDYVDATATGTTYVNEIKTTGVYGESITAGQVIYRKPADNKWYKSVATNTATFDNVDLAIAKETGVLNDVKTITIFGIDNNQTGLTAGATYYLSDTAGAISLVAGTYTVVVGRAHTTTELLVNPRDARVTVSDIVDLTATATEINQVCAGVGATVTASNLDTLTDTSNADSLHVHSGADGVAGVAGENITERDLVYAMYPDKGNFNEFTVASQDFCKTTNEQQLSQPVTVRKTGSFTTLKLKLRKVGSPTGNMTIEFQSDNAGNPSGTSLSTSGALDISTLTTSYVEKTFTFSSTNYTKNTLYHNVMKSTQTIDGSNYVEVLVCDDATYFATGMKYNGSSWSSISKQVYYDFNGDFGIELKKCVEENTHRKYKACGFADSTVVSGADLTAVKIKSGFSNLVIGKNVYLSKNVAGGISQGNDGSESIVIDWSIGIAVSRDKIRFEPEKFVTTTGVQSFIAGSETFLQLGFTPSRIDYERQLLDRGGIGTAPQPWIFRHPSSLGYVLTDFTINMKRTTTDDVCTVYLSKNHALGISYNRTTSGTGDYLTYLQNIKFYL